MVTDWKAQAEGVYGRIYHGVMHDENIAELAAALERAAAAQREKDAKIVEDYGYQIMPDQLADEVSKIAAAIRSAE